MGYRNRIQNGPRNCHGVYQSSGFEGKTRRVGSEPPKATRAGDEATQRVASGCRIWCPIMGMWHPQASYLSLDREVSLTPLRMGWHQAVWVFH
jgi:hypothetical protein